MRPTEEEGSLENAIVALCDRAAWLLTVIAVTMIRKRFPVCAAVVLHMTLRKVTAECMEHEVVVDFDDSVPDKLADEMMAEMENGPLRDGQDNDATH